MINAGCGPCVGNFGCGGSLGGAFNAGCGPNVAFGCGGSLGAAFNAGCGPTVFV